MSLIKDLEIVALNGLHQRGKDRGKGPCITFKLPSPNRSTFKGAASSLNQR